MLTFPTDQTSAWSLTDDELLDAIRWRRVHGASAKKAADRGATAFTRWLKRPSAFPKQVSSRGVPDPLWQVLWSRNAFETTGRGETVAGVVEHFAKDTSKKNRGVMLGMLLYEFDGSRPADPFELLALTTLLQTRRGELDGDTRFRLFRVCLLSARELSVEIDQEDDIVPVGVESADRHLVRRGELPLLIGRVFDAVHGSPRLRRSGRNTLNLLLDEETDTDGTPHGRVLDRIPFFVASLTRAVASRRPDGRDTFKKRESERFADLVRHTALSAGHDGRAALSSAPVFAPASLLHTAVSVAKLTTKDEGRVAASAIKSDLPKSARGTMTTKSIQPGSLVVESGQSEWGGVATFRGDAASPRFQMTVDFHDAVPRVDVQVKGRSVLVGPWHVETTIRGGQPLPAAETWSSVCWFSDDESDYLEIQADLAGGVQLTRHMIYAKEDGLLILAASVRNAGKGAVESTVRLPLAKGVSARPDTDDRLLHLEGVAPIRVVPLGLHQDPFDSTTGRMDVDATGISVTDVNSDDGLCVPMAFDLGPKKKLRRPIEWRRLTVAENGRVLSKGRGDGWRIRLGAYEDSPQWVYFQGLAPADGNRTVLGLHTPYEMVFGRFEDGEIDALVHIETD